MSRVGSKEIIIPENVKVSIDGKFIFAEGPLGKLDTKLHDSIETKIDGNKISFSIKIKNKQALAFWGLQRNLVNNIVLHELFPQRRELHVLDGMDSVLKIYQ